MLQHQIVQSPARLGLTNPNSPSLQNPTGPPKFLSSHQQQQHHPPLSSAAAIPTTSPALLSLLPPLPRAQSLLLQMASLASKLFEVSPKRALWLSAFRGSLPTFLSPQSQSQSQPPPPQPPLDSNPSTDKEIISLFICLQTQLFEAVADLQEILDLQDAKQRLAREIKSKDSTLLNFANKLKDAERVLDMLVDDYADYCRPKRAKSSSDVNNDYTNDTTIATQLKLSDILSYAHRISCTTFASPYYAAGQAPLQPRYPFPPEDQMRASQLYKFADLDVGLPKTVETKEKTIEAIIELPPPPPTQQPLEPNSFASLLPPNFQIPAGWKPGMPVELPKDLPQPPLGWKPGDPLPPLESIRLPRNVEQPAIHQALHKPSEPIQVRHVQLDIGDDEDSSDYSSEGESSDDED